MGMTMRKSPARGRHRRPAGHGRPAGHSHRRSKLYWLNAVALCLMASGVVMAFAGRDALRWAPPPIPSTWTAANGTSGTSGENSANGSTSAATHANLRPGYLIVRPLAGLVPAAFTNS
jgi:hypothetical protein